MKRATSAYGELERSLGHVFANTSLLQSALTHVSWLNESKKNGQPDRTDNGRLEFLGDAVLGLVVGEALMKRFPDQAEGDLSRARAAVVNENALARAAEHIGLGPWIFVGRGAQQSGDRARPSLLADTLEALVGAVYLDAGFTPAAALVERLLGDRMSDASIAVERDAKSRVQELVQGHLKITPSYHSVAEVGPPHERTFEVALRIGEREYARATGRSKQDAKQAAAARALPVIEAEIGSAPVPEKKAVARARTRKK